MFSQEKEVMCRMNLLFYATVTNGPGEQLQRVIEALVPKSRIEIYRTMDSLSARLRHTRYDLDIAILLATSREDLFELVSIRDLLDDLRIILVVPDREDETIAKGHELRPRFMTYIGGEFLDVAGVLGKMLRNNHPYR